MLTRTLPMVVMVAACALSTTAQRAHGQTARTIRYTKSSFGPNITRSVLTVPDTASHSLIQAFRIDTGHSDSPDFDVVEERVWMQGEARGARLSFAGYTVFILRTGEQVSLRWTADPTPTGTRIDGEPARESGTAIIIGGTGRFAGIRGRATYRSYAKGPVLEEMLLDIQ